jgi:hypothetical protein
MHTHKKGQSMEWKGNLYILTFCNDIATPTKMIPMCHSCICIIFMWEIERTSVVNYLVLWSLQLSYDLKDLRSNFPLCLGLFRNGYHTKRIHKGGTRGK